MAIYVYMRKRLTSQGLTTQEELAGPYWSFWRHRRFPWGELEAGDTVLLLDHWREEARLSWEVTATQVVHHRVESKDEAVTHIAEVFGLPEDLIADDPYLGGKEDGSGVLLAWRGEQVRRLNLPRPPGLKIARHGWGRLDDARAAQLLDDAARLVTPLPGFGDDAELDDAVLGGRPLPAFSEPTNAFGTEPESVDPALAASGGRRNGSAAVRAAAVGVDIAPNGSSTRRTRVRTADVARIHSIADPVETP